VSTATIVACGTEHTIELKRLNILCHDGSVDDIDVKGAERITPTLTVAMARQVFGDAKETYRHWFIRNEHLLRMVFGKDWQFKDSISDERDPVQHVVGLVLCTQLAIKCGRLPHIYLPETYLHPRQQCGLADLFNALTAPNAAPTQGEAQ